MIIDKTERIQQYAPLLPHLADGMGAVASSDLKTGGRYEFPGGWFMVMEGDTKPMEAGSYETHREYIDVHIVLEGEEEIAWSDPRELIPFLPYDHETDKERFTGEHPVIVRIKAGMFWAAFPEDAHQALCHTEELHHYRKIVMKLPLAE